MSPVRLRHSLAARRLFSSKSHLLATQFSRGPAPPRLPKEEQELFEKLQQSSTGAFSTPSRPTNTTTTTITREQATSLLERPKPQINQSPQLQKQYNKSNLIPPADDDSEALSTVAARVSARSDGEELHPDVRRGARPEFEGERNPKTGEIGGPKNEPLRWGGEADWSYNGRVTDF